MPISGSDWQHVPRTPGAPAVITCTVAKDAAGEPIRGIIAEVLGSAADGLMMTAALDYHALASELLAYVAGSDLHDIDFGRGQFGGIMTRLAAVHAKAKGG